ncbi:MAG: BMC domain-containing protein [Kofleriaceae bacterium]
MILEPIPPAVLSVRRLPSADPALIAAYGGDPARHVSLGLVTCDQDDALYVALDEATKHAAVDVIFARSFYAGAAHASGRLSGEILGVLAASEPQAIEDGLAAVLRCLAHDACFYDADGKRGVTVFPHVIASLGEYQSREAGLAPGSDGVPGRATDRGVDRDRRGAQGRRGARGPDHSAADRDQLRVRVADRRAGRLRGRGGRVRRRGDRCCVPAR